MLSKLIDELCSSDQNDRERAAREFVFLVPNEQSVRELAKALNDCSEVVRREAGLKLFIAGAKAKYVVPELVAALDHPDIFIRRTSAAALSMVGPDARDALAKLEQLRGTTDDKLRIWIDEAIARIQSHRNG